MAGNAIRFLNPYFNRFFAEQTDNIPSDYLKFFTSRERSILIKNKASFIKNASLEQKLLVLAKVGVKFAIVMVDEKKQFSLRSLWKMFRIFYGRTGFNKKKAVTDLKQAGVFAMCDVDIVRSFTIGATLYNTPVYNMLTSYTGMTNKIFDYHKANNTMQREITAMHSIDKMLSHVMVTVASARQKTFFFDQFGIEWQQYLILAFLSKARLSNLQDIVKGCPIVGIERFMRDLVDNNYIDRKTDGDLYQYMITGKGELTLNAARLHLTENIVL